MRSIPWYYLVEHITLSPLMSYQRDNTSTISKSYVRQWVLEIYWRFIPWSGNQNILIIILFDCCATPLHIAMQRRSYSNRSYFNRCACIRVSHFYYPQAYCICYPRRRLRSPACTASLFDDKDCAFIGVRLRIGEQVANR